MEDTIVNTMILLTQAVARDKVLIKSPSKRSLFEYKIEYKN